MKSISRRAARQRGGCILYLVATIFICAGSAFFVFMSGRPLLAWVAAQDWEAVDCRIQRSEVATHRSSDGTTYSVIIDYAYTWDGQPYRGSRYNFFDGSSSGLERKEAIMARFPAGSERVCYVDPENPAASVLDREFSFTYLIGCFGLIFIAVALAIFAGARSTGTNRGLSRRGHYAGETAAHPAEGALELKSASNSAIGCAVFLVFALIWNGIVAVIVLSVLRDWGSPSFDWIPALFLIPFVLIGLGILAAVGYLFLSLFNPKPDLVLSTSYLPLGGSAMLQWSFRGNTDRIRRLTITLCGQEKATYRRGTSSITDTKTFQRVELVNTEAPHEIMHGEVPVAVPEFTAPSFEAPNNKIVWELQVRGEIARWPDVKEDFVVQVSPLPKDAALAWQPAEFHEY